MGVPINNVTRRVVYAASGTGPYAFTFEILAATDIAVYRDDTLLTLTTDYTVTIAGNGTGSITLTAAPTGATQIAIVGNRSIQRTTDFVTGGDFFANTLNDELDQQTIFAQQNAEGLQRALQAPQTDPTSINMTLPSRTARANKTLSFDADGNPTPGVSAADVANAVTYATNAANSATAAASSASAAAGSASSASSSASTATTQASNAAASASAASTSASNASTSATNAANSASTATTQASNASTSATNAASSASTASTQASNAATSATNAANSASSASTSATNAANSATAAASSASSAAASAASAATALDSFDDRYLGTKASDPTLDNDGNALVSGALYFSTSQNIMKVYDGASWIAATSAGNTSLLRFRYIATAGQTSFSGADSNAATLTYTVNNIVVFLNGVALDQTEYTATTGTSVVLTTGAILNDELVIIAFKSFVTADMVPASTGGTYAGAVRFVAGSASVPSISVDGDTNTGIYFPAADTIAFTEGGTESLRLNSSGQIAVNAAGSASTPTITKADDLNTGVFFPAADTVAIGTGGTERLRVDSAGNAGLGVTPSASWWTSMKSIGVGRVGNAVFGATGDDEINIGANVINTGSGTYIYGATDTASLYRQVAAQHVWYRASSGTAGAAMTLNESMRIDSSGNLGLGVTPSAWKTNEYKAVQVGIGASFYGRVTAGDEDKAGFSANSFYDQTDNRWEYIATDSASRYDQTGGGHYWYTAPSGTAGNPITFTQAMTLDASGNLMLGATTASGAFYIQNSTNPALRMGYGGANALHELTWDSADFIISADIGNAVASNLIFRNDGSERARITSGGELWVARTTDAGAYNVQCGGTGVWGAGAYVNGSDERIKEDIAPITSGLDVVAKLNPVTYRYKEDWSKDQSTQTGFIAQELLVAMKGQSYVDGVVQQGGSEGYYSVAYQNIIPLLTKAIQEQQAMIDELKAKVAALENA